MDSLALQRPRITSFLTRKPLKLRIFVRHSGARRPSSGIDLLQFNSARANRALYGRIRGHGHGSRPESIPCGTLVASHRGEMFRFRVFNTESLILAQNERWRRGLGMQVVRESWLRPASKAANG
jgi:hypothetical protein